MKKNLMWFRNDFRVHDNTALYKACYNHTDIVIGLFISTPEQWLRHSISIKKKSFIYHHIIHLRKQLSDLNICLYYYQSTNFLESIKYLVFFCKKHKINQLFYNYQYEYNERNRDYIVKQKLSNIGILVTGFHDNLLVSHNKIKNKSHNTYKIFTAFKNKFLPILYENIPQCYPIPKIRQYFYNDHFNNFLYEKQYQYHFDKNIFPVGEKEAHKKLKNFCQFKIEDYPTNRNFPYLEHTSMLSPYLSIGVLSSRQCLMELLKNQKYTLKMLYNMTWFNEIIWREFYYHLFIGYPYLSQSQSLQPWEKNIIWSNDSKKFCFWKNGETGIPIIDAGMRQLKKIGWMHNRLRMITASFLVKNLLINWRKGEKYFISQLIDGDCALNNGGWQWAASVGSDAVSYVRIFNPLLQSKKIDKDGIFIKKFIPELNIVPNSYIHAPYEWAERENIHLEYPKPIIDLINTRKEFLLIIQKARYGLK